jgi:nitrite reductase/ring-hydroxylating ferredoxin subunit
MKHINKYLYNLIILMKRLAKYIVAAVFLLLIFNACKKENENAIPNTYVDIYIYATDPEFNSLSSIGGWAYITGGSRGIVVTRNSISEFAAFERHCPYNPKDPCGRVEVDSSSSIMLTDPCCGSNFLLSNGSVLNGPSTAPLRQYQTNFDGIVLHIFNQ